MSTDPWGGERDRYIQLSYRKMIRDALTNLGHTLPGRLDPTPDPSRRNDHAVRIVGDAEGETDGRLDLTKPITPNALGIWFGPRTIIDGEMGSDFAIHRWLVYHDLVGESRSYLDQVVGDLHAILRGRMPGTARTGEDAFPVHDWEQAGPDRPVIFWCGIEDVETDSPPSDTNPNWGVLSCDVVDER